MDDMITKEDVCAEYTSYEIERDAYYKNMHMEVEKVRNKYTKIFGCAGIGIGLSTAIANIDQLNLPPVARIIGEIGMLISGGVFVSSFLLTMKQYEFLQYYTDRRRQIYDSVVRRKVSPKKNE